VAFDVTVYVRTGTRRLEECVPTCVFTSRVGAGLQARPVFPRQVAEQMDEENPYVRDGSYCALEVTTHLGLEGSSGMVWIGRVGKTPTP
jgi:hypothetical protein